MDFKTGDTYLGIILMISAGEVVTSMVAVESDFPLTTRVNVLEEAAILNLGKMQVI